MPLDEPDLDGEYFLVTGSGQFFRHAIEHPNQVFGIVQIVDGGTGWRQVWGFSSGAKPTSEFATHLVAHAVRGDRRPSPGVDERVGAEGAAEVAADRRDVVELALMLQLEEASSWDFNQQTELGAFLFKQLLQIYREIAATHADTASESDKRDLTCLGRKISACYSKKRAKVPVVHKPIKQFHLLAPTFAYQRRQWRVFTSQDSKRPIVSSGNIIFTIAFLVWNGFFESRWIRMRPNTSHVTLQEVINLGNKISSFFGTYEAHDIDFDCYLEKEKVTKLLAVADFAQSPWHEAPGDYSVVYLNSWGELFVKRFDAYPKFESFLDHLVERNPHIITQKYVQRNPTAYEKTIASVKKLAFPQAEK